MCQTFAKMQAATATAVAAADDASQQQQTAAAVKSKKPKRPKVRSLSCLGEGRASLESYPHHFLTSNVFMSRMDSMLCAFVFAFSSAHA